MKKLFTFLMITLVSVNLCAKALSDSLNFIIAFEETLETRRGSSSIEKDVSGFWPYASQWFDGYAAADSTKNVTSNQYDNDYTAVTSYSVSVRGKKLNGASTSSVGLFFAAGKPADQDYVKFEGGFPTVTMGDFLKFEICSSEADGGDLSTMIVKVNDSALTVPATQLGAQLTTSTVAIPLPAGQIFSLEIAFDNVPSQKFISKFWIERRFVIIDGSDQTQGHIEISADNLLTAVPNHGYHFTQWLDSVTDNPRSITLTQDTTFTALFEKNPVPYLYCDSTMGYVYYRSFADSFPDMPKAYEYYEIFAEPYNGHHFVTWSDGNLEQTYRIIHITHDTVISATFAKNQYEVRTMPNYLSYGSTKGDTLVYYGDSVTIEATPNYGYHFGYWELGVYNYYGWQDTTSTNPVTIAIGENRICTAIFWPNTYRVICSSTDPEQGTVTADKRWADYLDSVHVTATPNYGYHFVRWTDGNTENPRRFFITQDTTFTAVFAIDRTGTCGDNMALNWQYDPTSYLLTISGNGTLNSNFTFGAEAPTQVQKLVVAEGVTTIGNSAFANYATLQEISLPTTLRTIYEQAFYNCVGLTHIYNFRERPCVAYSNTFDGIDKFDCTLHVLAESESMYRAATGWRDFYYIQTMEAGTVTVPEDTVIVEPTVNTVTFTWPVEENAASYTIEIYKEGVLVCTLIFNANGQLTGIAFAAPSREKHSHAPAALMTANGMQFTVTGLEGGTNYTYSVITKDAEEEVVASYEGEFTTVSQVPTAIDNVDASTAPRKLLHNGQILILRGDKTYTLTGQEVQ